MVRRRAPRTPTALRGPRKVPARTHWVACSHHVSVCCEGQSMARHPTTELSGLRRREDVAAALKQAFAGEQASALGRAGDRLEDAIDTYRLLIDVGAATDVQIAAALDEVVAAAYSLVVQRECTGFVHANRSWIERYYDVPAEALARL